MLFCFCYFFFKACMYVSRPIFINWCSVRSTLMLTEILFERHSRCYCGCCRQYCCRHLMLCRTRRKENHTHTHIQLIDDKPPQKRERKYCVWSSFSWTRLLFGWARTDENSSFVHTEMCILIRSHNIWELLRDEVERLGDIKYIYIYIKHMHSIFTMHDTFWNRKNTQTGERTNKQKWTYTCNMWEIWCIIRLLLRIKA